LTGNLTLAGSELIAGVHGNVTFPATGLTRTYTGAIVLSGSSTGRTFTTNGVTLAGELLVDGVGCEWTLGSALNNGTSAITVTTGNLLLSTYNLTAGSLTSNNSNSRTIDLGSSTVTVTTNVTFTTSTNLTFNAGTSTIIATANAVSINGGSGVTFYNYTRSNTVQSGPLTINGNNVFNDLTIAAPASVEVGGVVFGANQTINGTLTFSASSNATIRRFVRSDTIGTTRTLTCAAIAALTDIDFRDITIAGAAAPASGTRLGDCKGNSGITFPAAKTVYWNLAGNQNWAATAWATSLGGTPAANNFPLAQDTAVFGSASPASGATTTIDFNWNIGTIDMSARTANTMTLATSSNTPSIYGNWINGTGTTLTGTGTMTFAGRGSQTITSAGRTFTQPFSLSSPGGTLTLADAFTNSATGTALSWGSGTFDMAGYNATFSGPISISGALSKTLSVGSGTLTQSAASSAFVMGATGNSFTVTGTGTISLTSASAKTFSGGSLAYTNITLNQGGAGALTITGNNTFKDITNTYKSTGAANINIGTTTQRVSQWTGAGEAGRLLTVQGSSASSPGTLILTSAVKPDVDYLTITGVRAYDLTDTWYAGANSTNNGSLGWLFQAAPTPVVTNTGTFFFFFR
jgi:hypothetical protein